MRGCIRVSAPIQTEASDLNIGLAWSVHGNFKRHGHSNGQQWSTMKEAIQLLYKIMYTSFVQSWLELRVIIYLLILNLGQIELHYIRKFCLKLLVWVKLKSNGKIYKDCTGLTILCQNSPMAPLTALKYQPKFLHLSDNYYFNYYYQY